MNILMVALHYHDYTRAIADEFEQMGHNVSLHDIQPRSLPRQILRNISRPLWERSLHHHHAKILEKECGTSYDMVLFVQVHQLLPDQLRAFRDAFQDARFVLYNWDSIDNHDYRPFADQFDDIYTFDPGDAIEHGYKYLPLFCLRQFQFADDPREVEKGVYFVGNLGKIPRYLAIAEFREYCEQNGIPFKTHLATTPPIKAALIKAGHMPRGLASGPISKDDFIAMMRSVSATFDFANHDQTGFTMRVIENLCAGKKIITSNKMVLDAEFYSPDRIHVFEETDFCGVAEFLDEPLARPDEKFEDYRIQAFARHLVRGTSHTPPSIRSK